MTPSMTNRRPRLWCWAAGGALVASVLGLTGCASPAAPRDFEPVLARFLLETPVEARGAQTIVLPRSTSAIAVYPRPVLTESDIANVELVKVDLGLCLLFEYNVSGAKSLLRLSGSNLGRRLVLTLNGAPFGARMLDAPITDGRFFIFVEMADEQLADTAVDLKRTAQEIQAAIARGQARKS